MSVAKLTLAFDLGLLRVVCGSSPAADMTQLCQGLTPRSVAPRIQVLNSSGENAVFYSSIIRRAPFREFIQAFYS